MVLSAFLVSQIALLLGQLSINIAEKVNHSKDVDSIISATDSTPSRLSRGFDVMIITRCIIGAYFRSQQHSLGQDTDDSHLLCTGHGRNKIQKYQKIRISVLL